MRTSKTLMRSILMAYLSVAVSTVSHAADFTWRGQLADGGKPAHGSYDLSVAVYAEEAGKAALGGAIEFEAVSVSDGAFAVTLPVDDATDLDEVWLEVGVRDAGESGEFEILPKRQRVYLTPLAVCPASWETAGNAGLASNNFLGTTDETALRVRVGNREAMRVLPSNDLASHGDAPNLILGSSANEVVGTGIEGATISGGGSSRNGAGGACSFCNNRVSDDFASIGGGFSNQANGSRSRVGGGAGNLADGSEATISGGLNNRAPGDLGTVSGGNFNFASGRLGAVPGGDGNVAGGDYSFAAGRVAHVRDASEAGDFNGDEGTFVWSDATTVFPSSFSSTGPNQFLVNANGGFALNATPINANVEMNIRPNASGANYANVFLRQRGTNAGVLWSVGDATGSSNNAAFYVDQYDGSAQTRRLTLAGNGDLTVSAGAFKPGGGSWSVASDARLKQNVTELDHALDRLLALKGVSFEYAEPDPDLRPAGRLMGFVAQQVEPLFPNWVGQDAEGFLTVGTQGFEALTVEAVRELRNEKNRQIAALQAENRALVDKLKSNEELTTELLARLDALSGQHKLLATRLDALVPGVTQLQRVAVAGGR